VSVGVEDGVFEKGDVSGRSRMSVCDGKDFRGFEGGRNELASACLACIGSAREVPSCW